MSSPRPSHSSHTDMAIAPASANALEHDIERYNQALKDLFEYDRAVTRRERPADRKQRWLLDLLVRSAALRYEASADPF